MRRARTAACDACPKGFNTAADEGSKSIGARKDVAHGACHWGDWASPHDSDKLNHSDVVDALLAPVLLLVLGVVVKLLFFLLHVVDRDCLHLLRVLRRVILPNSVFVIPLSDFVKVEAFKFSQNLQLVVV